MKIICEREKDTRALGKKIARCLEENDIICLVGELGSGKTALTKGIAVGLGIGQEEVISPTFVLIRQYRGRLVLNHFDLYRLGRTQDIIALGYEEYLYGGGVSVIEWAERLGCLTPEEYLQITIRAAHNGRRTFSFRALGSRYVQLLKELKKSVAAFS